MDTEPGGLRRHPAPAARRFLNPKLIGLVSHALVRAQEFGHLLLGIPRFGNRQTSYRKRAVKVFGIRATCPSTRATSSSAAFSKGMKAGYSPSRLCFANDHTLWVYGLGETRSARDYCVFRRYATDDGRQLGAYVLRSQLPRWTNDGTVDVMAGPVIGGRRLFSAQRCMGASPDATRDIVTAPVGPLAALSTCNLVSEP